MESGRDIASELDALSAVVRLGAPTAVIVERLEALCAETEDPIVGVYARHARALLADDPVGQLRSAVEFEERGLDLLAAEAAMRAAVSAKRGGLRDTARYAGVVAQRCQLRCPGVVTPALGLRIDVPTLTPREREIAELAARGMPNAAIAEQFVLSVRTVETNVLRACRKLGITARTELADALRGT